MNSKQIEFVLIEDNPDDANLAIRELKKNNMTGKFIHLKDGEEALNFFFGINNNKNIFEEHNIKLILLDLKMPKVDGLEILKELRKNKITGAVPVVIFTSSAETKDIEKAYQLGVNSYIVKPVDFAEFTKVIKEIGYYWLSNNIVYYS